jgi:hypothetical protein
VIRVRGHLRESEPVEEPPPQPSPASGMSSGWMGNRINRMDW